MALGSGLLQLFGARECFSESKYSSADITALCHDVNGLDLSKEDKIFITVKDLRKPAGAGAGAGEQVVPLGSACQLKSVEFDSALLLRVWAARDEDSARLRGSWGRRNCGELRIPLQRLVASSSGMSGMLYQTWVTLDCPGLNDSVASVGLGLGLGDEALSFEHRLVDGPRQLFQPRAFLSLGRSADLGPKAECLLSSEASTEARVAHWVPLLRSQQQHAMMSAALHIQSAQAQGLGAQGQGQGQGAEPPTVSSEQRAQATARLQDLRGRVRAQTESLQALRQQVQEAEDELQGARDATRRCMTGVSPVPTAESPGSPDCADPESPQAWRADGERLRSGADLALGSSERLGGVRAVEGEVEELRRGNNALQARLGALHIEVDRVRQEGNDCVDTANEQIRRLKRERDEAIRECKRLEAEADQLALRKAELESQKKQSSQRVQDLKRLVEEVYETINESGMQGTVKNVDSIRAIFRS